MQQAALSSSNINDAAQMSLAPGQYGYDAPVLPNEHYLNDGIMTGGDRVGATGVDTESKLRGLGEHLTRYDTIRSTPSSTNPMVKPTGMVLPSPEVRSKVLQRGTAQQQWGIRDVYPVRDLVACTPVADVVTQWGVNTRDVARESC